MKSGQMLKVGFYLLLIKKKKDLLEFSKCVEGLLGEKRESCPGVKQIQCSTQPM